MLKHITILTLISLSFCEETTTEPTQDDNVIVLNDDNFDDYIKSNEHVFVKFYAPWCGHCKAMAKPYASLAKKMHEGTTGVKIAKVDATESKGLASRFEIQGFPTLKFFKNGEPIEYKSGRTESEIENWIMKKTGPSSNLITTPEDYTTHQNENISVLYHGPEDEEESLKKYQAFASEYDDIKFAHSHQTNLRHEDHSDKKYGITVFRNFDEGHKHLSSDEPITVEQMRNFLEEHRYPFVQDFDQDAANRIFGQQKTAIIMMTDETDSEQLTTFKNFAKNNQNEYIYSISPITKGFGARLAEYIGVKSEQDPTIRIISFDQGNLNKYIVENVTEAGIKEAIENFRSGKLEAHYKSAAIPETNDEPVKVVVGDNFDDLVLTQDKYVLLEAYAPWCGHCKKLEPIYKELAEKLAKEEDITIAKMDATENEHPKMPVQGFPTLRLFAPGKDEPIDYSGDRTLKDLVEFLEKNVGRTFSEIKSEDL